MSEIIGSILNLSVLVFVVSSMLAMGLSLTIQQIIKPLCNSRIVMLSLVVNFIFVPILAYLIVSVIHLEPGVANGLIIISTAAGAPLLPKLAQVAKGNIGFSVGLMVLLMITTLFYMPIVIPLLLHGVEVSPLKIAQDLIIKMLIPLTIGLLVKVRYEFIANSFAPIMSLTSSITIGIIWVTGITLNWNSIIGFLGIKTIFAILVFILVALIIGFLSGGSDTGIRSVLGVGTAQRNLAAAMLVVVQNFPDDPIVLSFILVVGLIGPVLLILIGNNLLRKLTIEEHSK